MQSAKAITNENVELEEKRLAERQAKLDEGYKLYPGVGWVKNESIEEPIYTNHPDTGEKIIDLEATMKDREDRNVELDGCVWPDTSGWTIADSKHEPSKTVYYAHLIGKFQQNQLRMKVPLFTLMSLNPLMALSFNLYYNMAMVMGSGKFRRFIS